MKHKKLFMILISLTYMLQITTFADIIINNQFKIGSYYQMGKYKDEPLLWRCIDIDDENGVLLLSDKILCYKRYDTGTPGIKIGTDRHNVESWGPAQGNYLWEESALRDWLNSNADYKHTEWHRNIPENIEFNPYNGEKGFLSNENFTESEKNVMKTVNQWQLLHYFETHLNENNIRYALGYDYNPQKPIQEEPTIDSRFFWFGDNSAYDHIEAAMYRSTETVFILTPKQAQNMCIRFGTLKAEPTQKAKEELYEILKINISDYPDGIEQEHYWWISRPWGNFEATGYIKGDNSTVDAFVKRIDIGVRPAFYVNESNAIIKSGSGTETDPYILDGKEQTDDIMVFCNSEQVEFDQQPVIENDRLLVPVRAIFEQLGAAVEYDANNQLITARNDEKVVTLQIDNPELNNGAEIYTLDVAPKIIGDRTMVPLRAVSEAFSARVRYIDNLRRVSIDKPELPMDFGEGVGLENWQQDKELRKKIESSNWYPNIVEYRKKDPIHKRYWLQNEE